MGNLRKLFRNSKLFRFTSTQSEACDIWKVSETITFEVITDLDPDLFMEKDPFSLEYFRGRIKVTHSMAHYPLGPGTAWAFCIKMRIWWIEIHVSQFRYDNPYYLTFNSHLLLPHNSSLFTCSPSTLSLTLHHPPSVLTICVIFLSFLPTTSTSLISIRAPPLHRCFTSHSVPSKTLLEPAASEFWSATLWPKKACQTAFPINQ